MKRKMTTALVISLLMFSISRPIFAGDHRSKKPSTGAIVADAIVLRPVGFCGTVIGVTAFVISLPVSVPTK